LQKFILNEIYHLLRDSVLINRRTCYQTLKLTCLYTTKICINRPTLQIQLCLVSVGSVVFSILRHIAIATIDVDVGFFAMLFYDYVNLIIWYNLQ